MCIISVPNLKEIETWEGYFMRLKILCKKEEKCEENQEILRNKYLKKC